MVHFIAPTFKKFKVYFLLHMQFSMFFRQLSLIPFFTVCRLLLSGLSGSTRIQLFFFFSQKNFDLHPLFHEALFTPCVWWAQVDSNHSQFAIVACFRMLLCSLAFRLACSATGGAWLRLSRLCAFCKFAPP